MIKFTHLKKMMKNRFLGVVFALILTITGLFGGALVNTKSVYAEPVEGENTSVADTAGASCEDSLGSLGWLVCPATGKISEAVDWLYDKIEGVLVINPVEAKDGSPVYEIWKYFLGFTNIVFVVFLLVVILSQVTGIGITNYGIKKALPKLVIAAILVNLSFFICSLAVDVSNIFGDGLRGLFENIVASTRIDGSGEVSTGVRMSQMYSGIASGAAVAVGGGLIAFETGAIWMLIPLALGALASVVIGLVTIALRQAVVVLLVMIAPLAMVAYILPNTEQWFKKWRHLLFQMLIFYPAFSLLFGASSVAGWAIIVSSQSGFGTLVGVAVQIFPLFFSWHLMKMSGTFLGKINATLTNLANRPLKSAESTARAIQQNARAKHLAGPKSYMPSMRLQQYLSDRRIALEEETKEHSETVRKRGLAYAAMRNYKRDGETPSAEGEQAYEEQARSMEYERRILRHKNNMNKGLGQLEVLKKNGTAAQRARLQALDTANVLASDKLKMEQARGEVIDYNNAVGYHNRMEGAINAHMDEMYSEESSDGRRIAAADYRPHFDLNGVDYAQANARYSDLSKIMEGNVQNAHYAAAAAAHAYDTQSKIYATNLQKYFELAPPTKDVTLRLEELTTNRNAALNIDGIVSGLRVLNMRGDTDLIKKQIDNILDPNIGGGVQLGTHASQSLASFLMFDVKDSDPWLRRFGKYINLETARAYNNNERKDVDLSYEEYVRGYHDEVDQATGEVKRMFAKKGMTELMEGTSLDNIERTALANFDDSLKKVYTTNGKLDVKAYLDKREEVQTAIGPQFISASLKYLSGSEQLTSAVKFLTGYGKKQVIEKHRDKDGNEYEAATSVWRAAWETGGDLAGEPEMAREYFQKKTLQYLGDQTPSQILGLRSDYYAPLLNHLANAYEEESMEGWDEEAISEHEEFAREKAEIQTRYGDLPADEARQKRESDMKALRNKMAGAEFRHLLDNKGKLNQIYRTRRSGAANNAKDWLRKWLDLDNEVAITVKLENDKRKLKEEYKKAKEANKNTSGDVPSDDGNTAGRIYSAEDMADFVSHIEDLWHDLREEDDDEFYNESLDYIRKNLGNDSFIAEQYKNFRKEDPYADSHMMKEFLTDLLNDPENY
ncbi:MAG: hypothetical protein Q4B87_01235 [Candidatus Saccharibacteria bacterium]|nr:hypothetical protein [Candidatus Saccharibacteria bacterium]